MGARHRGSVWGLLFGAVREVGGFLYTAFVFLPLILLEDLGSAVRHSWLWRRFVRGDKRSGWQVRMDWVRAQHAWGLRNECRVCRHPWAWHVPEAGEPAGCTECGDEELQGAGLCVLMPPAGWVDEDAPPYWD